MNMLIVFIGQRAEAMQKNIFKQDYSCPKRFNFTQS